MSGLVASGYAGGNPSERTFMPSLIDRVTTFGRSPKGQGLIRQAMNRFSGGGGDTRKGRRAGTRRGPGARRRGGGTRRRAMRKR
jgi:hypothetical protein